MHPIPLLLFCVLMAALGLASTAADPARATESDSAVTRAPLIEFDPSPHALIVRFGESGGELAEAGGAGTLEIWGDGRVVVDNPPTMKRAGRHTLQLEDAALRRLLRRLARKGLLEFDESNARKHISRKRSRAREARTTPDAPSGASHDPGVLFSRSDEGVTDIELRLTRYRAQGQTGEPQRDVRKRVRWRDVERDARRHPELGAIQDLAAARREIRALMRRHDLRRSE